jgi:Domain of unknown function (DUF4157)
LPEHFSISSPAPTVAPAAAKDILPAQEPVRNDLVNLLLHSGAIQFKLSVGSPDDPLEHEADAMADTILRMPSAPLAMTRGMEGEAVQRKCHCEEEENLQRKPLVSFIQRKESSSDSIASDTISNQLNASRGSGGSMDTNTQTFMQSRFGADFSDVKIHTGGESVQMNRELNAKAFTVGKDIYFNEGQYNPNSSDGKHLLAHELTHTVQQGIHAKAIQRACGSTEIGNPAGCTGTSMLVPERPRYLFNVNCDTFLTGNELDLRIDALSFQNGETIDIHGLASEEGTVEFNMRLSCARALSARNVIEDVLRRQGISATIRVFSHGPQEGNRPVNRSVAIIRHGVIPPPEDDDPQPVPSIPSCSGMYTDGHDETLDGDHDLDQLHHSGESTWEVLQYDALIGEPGASIDFYLGFFGGTGLESTSDDDDLYNHFMTGSGSRLNFNTATDMATILGSSPTFISFAAGFETAVRAHIAASGTLCGFDGNSYLAANRPAYFHSPVFAWAVMGGYSRLDANVVQTAGGGITVTYRIYDHFGAGVSDASSLLPGLPALYYLQHFHGSYGSRYTPFIWSVQIGRSSP